jgi:chaperonin GroES
MPTIEKMVAATNIAPMLKEEDLATIGKAVVTGYEVDRASRSQWEERQATAVKLALQVVEVKDFPWTNCSNVKFPLVTVAALQFLSRVAILTKGRQLVKCDVLGPDADGKLAMRAKRISAHMSYQLVEEDRAWIDDDEKAKLAASIIGCAFKKSYFDPVRGKNISEHVPAMDFVVDYRTKSLEKANRMTHLLTMTDNDIQERVASDRFVELKSDRGTQGTATGPMQAAVDESQGTQSQGDSDVKVHEVLEQHCWLDLDEDGYREPYIVWVHKESGQVLRIAARYFDQGDVHRKNDLKIRTEQFRAATLSDEGKAKADARIKELQEAKGNVITRIDAQQFFTKIPFIPSPDGGFYDLGLGALLGPINASVDTLVNQLIDAGTMSNTAGGFLGRGVKLKGGKSSFDPFEWKPVDSPGDDLRKNIVPLPVRDPSAVLFQLLGLLVSYGEKISGATDIMTGVSPGQNTPAETSRNTIEQGMKIFSGIYGRMYRAFQSELRLLFDLNRMYLPLSAKFIPLTTGENAIVSQKDYIADDALIFPAADPAVVSETQRQQRAMMLKQNAAATPGYDRYQVELDFLQAFDIQDIERIYPNPKGPHAVPPPVNPQLELEKAQFQLEQQKFQSGLQVQIAELQSQDAVNQAKVQQLEAQAAKLLAEANGVDVSLQVQALNAQTGAAKAHQEGIRIAMETLQRLVDQHHDSRKLDIAEAAGKAKAAAASTVGAKAPASE